MAQDAVGSTGEVAADHPVLLFDGVCNLCAGSVQFVVERDPAGRFRFAPLQSDVARDLLAGHDVDPGELDTVVLLEDGETYTKSDAALRVARGLQGPISLLWHGRFVPRPVRDAVYDVVAAVRYDLFGRKDRCMVPSPELRERFLATSD
jgi:predicted DCC family thiol-disulfide oxidoreductase YuxK